MSVDEEDDELLLEGHELHKYLQKNTNEQCLLFEANRKEFSDAIAQLAEKDKVPEQIKKVIEIILQSQLLLDEDAHNLFYVNQCLDSFSSHLVMKSCLGVGTLVLGASSIALTKQGESLLSSLCIGGFLVSAYYYKQYQSYNRVIKYVCQLSHQMSLLYDFIKKELVTLHETISFVASKEMYLQYKKYDTVIIKGKYNWVRHQISLMSVELFKHLMRTIYLSKTSSVNVLQIIKKKCTEEEFYAGRTNEQLGIKSIQERYNNKLLNLTDLEKLRNMYIILQSEFLKLVGLSIIQMRNFHERGKLAKILLEYNFELREIMKYSKNSKFFINNMDMNTKIQPLTKFPLNCRDSLLESITHFKLHLQTILYEVMDIEDILQSNRYCLDDELNLINVSLEQSSFELIQFESFIKKFKQKINRTKKLHVEKRHSFSAEAESIPQQSHNINTGFTDNSDEIIPKDEVYLDITSGVEGNSIIEDDIEDTDEESFTLAYNNVITEIKVALAQRREEFMRREIIASEKNPNYAAYMKFESATENIDSRQKSSSTIHDDQEAHACSYAVHDTVHQEPSSSYAIDQQASGSHLSKETPETDATLTVAQLIAKQAVTKSLQWRSPICDEFEYDS